MITLVAIATLSFSSSFAQSVIPELVFQNPVLISGNDKKEGAVYRFSNVATNVDAEIKFKKFSRSDIYMHSADQADAGWMKAFQPQFGVPGTIAPNQDWYIDFEMKFFKAGTDKKQKMQNIAVTALDLDGSAYGISEYVIYDKPKSVSFSSVTYLTNIAEGTVGTAAVCGECGGSNALYTCSNCNGSGINSSSECGNCKGSGLLHSQCSHAYTGLSGTMVNGALEEFMNIDTSATQVMVTYKYENKDKVNFRYGGRTRASGGSGIRQYSSWFKEFSLAPPMALPVYLTSFTAGLSKSSVVLNWNTVNPKTFSHFVVERSINGSGFIPVATVPSGSGANYSYEDANMSAVVGIVYYRLRMVDDSKEFVFSKVRVIRFAKEQSTIALITYPNPATSEVQVSLPVNWQTKAVTLELFNANGIRVQSHQLKSASQTEVMQLSKVSTGMYLVKASCEGQTALQRIFKN